MTQRAFLCGYYGMKNSGDDALLLATAWGAKKFLGNSRFAINSPVDLSIPGLGEFPPSLKPEQSFRGENRLRQYRASLASNRVIFGGGSVLHNAHDIGIKRHMIKLSGRKKALALGIGIGPFRNKEAENACAKLLDECAFVGVRDRESLDIANSIAPAANVELTFDLAPLLLAHNFYPLPASQREGIAVCLCPNERFSGNLMAEQNRLKALAASLLKIHRQTGKRITLLDFNGHPTLGDTQVHQELLQQLPSGVVAEHIHYNPNPLTVVHTLSRFELVIGMRLHAAILAFIVDTPVISLNYHSKCYGWCKQIGMAENLQFNSSHIDPERLTASVIQGLDKGFPKPVLNRKDAFDLALNNWRC
ncbi:polysaccharide pyruvyl transferase family protein [Teredinibacter haidensis]|uniref:polysaccharide pyruvyl transferase family protein n=1 Tax=Teredinibacter haidensis TaxID=2731755 RepID=UPI000948AF8B|nr:polysaccharide pyruvyl transferase family protein [Teredinibacter haidensis]